MSCELLNCDVPKLLDFFTLTESQRQEKDRKTSSVDSDLGISDSINSNSENTWFEKRDDLYQKAKTEENYENVVEGKDNAHERVDLPAAEENKKPEQVDENACEVINVDGAQDNKIAKKADVQEKNEG